MVAGCVDSQKATTSNEKGPFEAQVKHTKSATPEQARKRREIRVLLHGYVRKNVVFCWFQGREEAERNGRKGGVFLGLNP